MPKQAFIKLLTPKERSSSETKTPSAYLKSLVQSFNNMEILSEKPCKKRGRKPKRYKELSRQAFERNSSAFKSVKSWSPEVSCRSRPENPAKISHLDKDFWSYHKGKNLIFLLSDMV